MEKPRIARSAKIAEMNLDTTRIPEQPSVSMPGTVDKIIPSPRPSQPEQAQIAVEQVGVTPLTTSGSGNSTSGGGFGTVPVAGNGDTGQFSINGQRESANGFTLNGVSVQETIGQQAGIVPNLDSIAEFRILTSNADAEYGNYSGGLISVVTKSGGNQLHGDIFEFLRNTALDARGFFDPTKAEFQQNQFGGTLGGPIKKNKVFFFAD
jgi:hypothetical protein